MNKAYIRVALGLVIVLLVVAGLYARRMLTGPVITEDHGHQHLREDEEMISGRFAAVSPVELELQIPLVTTRRERATFAKELAQFKSFRDADRLRPLYERYIDVIGANGIINTLQTQRPLCHWEGHSLGRVIYNKLKHLGPSLLTCQDACNSGCMHGVITEAFAEAPGKAPSSSAAREPSTPFAFEQARTLKERVRVICDDPGVARLYKKGDCSHGVGHALMMIDDYDLRRAIDQCGFFNLYAMRYYCATGGYMEYVTHHDREDNRARSLYYPCDVGDYPAACFRYKMVHVMYRHYASGGHLSGLVKQCMTLKDKFRLGCFHGLGNAHMGFVSKGQASLAEICRFGTDQDQSVCIDGAVERLAKYFPDKARRACETLEGWRSELCRAAAERNMYSLTKSFELYSR